MVILSRKFGLRAGRLALPIACVVAGPLAAASDDRLALRNHNPFLQIFGLPTFQSATLARKGKLEYDFSAALTNHADSGENALETLMLDGETYSFTMSLRRRMAARLELGIDLPIISHQDGFLDNVIKEWHSFLGVSNFNRRGPTNELEFMYTGPGDNRYELTSSSTGIGDIQLTAAIPLREASDTDGRALSVRSSVKLPTGDEKKLHGSGALDFSLGLYASDTRTFLERKLDLSAFVGGLVLGDGDVLPDLQRSTVPFGGVAAKWQATERLGILTQIYAQGEYFDSDLEEIGDGTFQLGIGVDYFLPSQGISLAIAIAEDPLSDTTPDFAIQFSIRSARSGSRPILLE
jgi:hypothetical protein